MNGIVWGLKPAHYRRIDRPQKTIGDSLVDGLDLCSASAGFGWEHGIKNPDEACERLSRKSFVISRLVLAAKWLLLLDVIHIVLPTIGSDKLLSLEGDSIFDPTLAAPLRHLKSSTLSILISVILIGGLQAASYLAAAFFVGVLNIHPKRCPPAFNSPWASTSLASFWSRWQQMARHPLVNCGGKPLAYILGGSRTGLVLGTFLMSGIVHDISVLPLGKGAEPLSITMFFFMMGLGVVLEAKWKEWSGRMVAGWTGWVWTMCWIILWANRMVDAVARRGTLGTSYLGGATSPMRIMVDRVTRRR